ncbi:MAG: carbohydrate ABC transporter permease [Clostridiales bacterium]|nr:carbohydrate ABC transporter permease [Clostridiales bacterium]
MKKMKASISTKTKFSPLTISLFVVLALYVVFLVVMFLWAFLTASKGYYTDYFSFEPSKVPHNIVGLPKEFVLFQNLAEINDGFSDYTLVNMALNTILYAVGCSLSKVVVTCVVAYLCSRYENLFSKIVYVTVIVTMIVPVVGSQAAEIQLAKELLLFDSLLGMWVMRANFLGMYFLVFFSVFKSMPKGYYEAAKIDGANDFQIMVKVALPLVKYTFLSIFLILFIEYWNDYLIPNLYLPSYTTLSLALYWQSQGQEISNPDLQRVTYVMATVLLVTIPVIVIFSVFSKRLMGNLSVGGLKG